MMIDTCITTRMDIRMRMTLDHTTQLVIQEDKLMQKRLRHQLFLILKHLLVQIAVVEIEPDPEKETRLGHQEEEA